MSTLRCALCLAVCLIARSGLADVLPRSRAMLADTITEIFVERDMVAVEFEIGAASFDAFRNILPDELHDQLGFEPEAFTSRAVTFLEQDFTVRLDGGPPLLPRIRMIEGRPRPRRDEVTGDTIAASGDERILFVRIEYDFEGRPDQLTVRPPRRSDDIAASIGFVAYHQGLAVNDFRYLSQEETLEIDWNDPWYSRFENRNLLRYFDSPMLAFLYVEPFEVRKEIVLRPVDVAELIGTDVDATGVIPAADRAEIERATLEFIGDHGAISIDGRRVEPQRVYANFIQRTLRGTAFVPDGVDVAAVTATLGVICVYPTAGWPDEVTLDWDIFTPRIESVPAIASDSAGGLPSIITKDDPTLVWRNYLTNPQLPTLVEIATPLPSRYMAVPALSLCLIAVALIAGLVQLRRRRRSVPGLATAAVACIAAIMLMPVRTPFPRSTAPQVSAEGASEISRALLTNVYRAFDFATEGDVYDTLARSTTGDMLGEVYTTINEALVLQQETGMSITVDDVEIIGLTSRAPTATGGFEAVCTWNVAGSVSHWGHVHRRLSQYEADIVVAVVDDTWKLTALQPRRQERLDTPNPY